jgi:hypothetical protein
MATRIAAVCCRTVVGGRVSKMGRPKSIKGFPTTRNISGPSDTFSAFFEVMPPNLNFSGWVIDRMEEEILSRRKDKAVFTSDLSAISQMVTNIQHDNNTLECQIAIASLNKLIEYSRNNRDVHYVMRSYPKAIELERLLRARKVVTEADKLPEYRPSRVLEAIEKERQRNGASKPEEEVIP